MSKFLALAKFWLDLFLREFFLKLGLTVRSLTKAISPQLVLAFIVIKALYPQASFKLAFVASWALFALFISRDYLRDTTEMEFSEGEYF